LQETYITGFARRADGPDDEPVRVVKSVWYYKHIDIEFVTTSASQFLFRMDEQTERRLCYGAMDDGPDDTADDGSPH